MLNDMAQLREQAKMMGLPAIKHETKDALTARIYQGVQDTTKPKPKFDKPEVIKYYSSPESILEALKPYIDKGLKITFDDDSYFFKRDVAEDSGTLHQSLNAIRNSARVMMQARHPAKIKNSTGELVLAG